MIKGITPRLAEAGKIKIGGLGEVRKARGGREYRLPQKYDHFVITTNQRNDDGLFPVDTDLMGGLAPDPDGKVRAIPIVLHSDVIDEVFPTAYALYTGRRCACRGDGETARRREIKDKQYTGAEKTIPCPCDYLGADQPPVCKPNGKLFCSIASPQSAVAGAVHIWRTTSIISIEQMVGSLLQIKAVCGTLRGVPLWLRVKPITVEPPGQGAITVYCCHVELRAADVRRIQEEALEAARRRCELGLDDSEYSRMLTLPAHEESIEEQEEIEGEFYPENGPAGADAGDGERTRLGELTQRLQQQHPNASSGVSADAHPDPVDDAPPDGPPPNDAPDEPPSDAAEVPCAGCGRTVGLVDGEYCADCLGGEPPDDTLPVHPEVSPTFPPGENGQQSLPTGRRRR